MATSPVVVVACGIIFLGSAATYFFSTLGVGYVESRFDWTIRTAILLSGVVMLTLVMWRHQTRNRKAPQASPNAFAGEEPTGRFDSRALLTDWRYSVRPVRPVDLVELMERGEREQDRRRDERFQIGNVRATLMALGTQQPEQECVLVDISAGGGRVLAREPLPIGALVKLAALEILLIGEVRHCESADGLQVIGVKFAAKIDRSHLRLMTRGFVPVADPARK